MGYWGLLAYDATTGTYSPRKSYYAIEQVMRDVPRGAVRVSSDASAGDVAVESFLDRASGRLTIVLHNHASSAQVVSGAIVGGATGIASLSTRHTDATANYAAGADVAVDSSGHWSATLRPDSVETLTGVPAATPPTATITSGPDGTTTATSATFAFSADEADATFECRLDGGDWAACTSPHSVSGLAVGDHSFAVRATTAAGTGPAASRSWTVSAPPSAPAELGNDAVEQDLDTVAAGQAEAFPVTADGSGTVDELHVYVDGRSSAARLVAGVYADAGGHPGRLLAQQDVSAPAAGWTAMSLPGVTVAHGTRYWLAVLGPGGTLAFRDRIGGGCNSETSASSSLSALPATWDGGQDWNTCLVSAYASG
jgi:hypothetical protein